MATQLAISDAAVGHLVSPLSLVQVCQKAWHQAQDSMQDALVQQQAIEGATLRAVAAFAAYPLDVLKTQVQAGNPRYPNLRAAPVLISDYRMNVFRGYPGVGYNAFVMGALMFGGYRFFDNFWKLNGVSDYWRPAIAGASIGGICGLVAAPMEQVKTVLALQEGWVREGKMKERKYTSVVNGALHAPMRLKFYAVTPLMFRTAVFDSQLFFYNSRLREWMAHNSASMGSTTKVMISTFGFMTAGLVGATINYPLDLVKGRMMGEAFAATNGDAPKRTMIYHFRTIVAENGLTGLFKGLPTRSILHATVWCVVGIGRELCERLGVRDSARKKSAEQGHSKNLSA